MVRIFRHFIPVQILILAGVDVWILSGSMYLGIGLRFFTGDMSGVGEISPIYPKALIYALVMLATMVALGLYQRDVVRADWGYYVRLLASLVVGTLVTTLVFYIFPGLFLGRGAFALTVLFSALGVVMARGAFLRVVNTDVLKKRILVLGAGSRAAQIEQILKRDGLEHKFYFVGYLPMGGTQHSVEPSRILKDSASLLAIAIRREVDEIIVAIRDRRGGNLSMGDLLECKLEGIQITDVSSFFEREMGCLQIDSLNPSWMVFSDGFCRSSARGIIKRLFDVTAAGALLIATLPVMVLTALAILLETGFPIFYRQVRVGECGQLFAVLKFRSMRRDAERDGLPQWAQKNDNRVTRIGRVIRVLRIDELPQIFNVLVGDMSFVGPRPERPQFVRELAKAIPYYSSRHAVKPGITGWAQINYPYGASVDDAREKLQYDLYYTKNHSLFLDVAILMQTAQVVLFGKGAR